MLTPRDIETKVFKTSFRGYQVDDVEDFLQELGESYAKVCEENRIANERIAMLSDAVKQYQSMEDALSDAEHLASGTKQNVQKEADEIIRQARKQAEEIITRAGQEMARASYEYEQMKRSVEVFRAKVVSLLNAQLEIIKDYSQVQIDEKTIEDAKRIYENTVAAAEEKIHAGDSAKKPLSEQKTEKIPPLPEI